MNAIHPHLLKSNKTIDPATSVAESAATDTHAERRPGLDEQPQARLQPAERDSVPTVAGDPAVVAANEAARAIMEIDNATTPADRRDLAVLFSNLLKKREHFTAVVGMPDGFHGRALDRDEADPYTNGRDGGEEPVPHLGQLLIEPGSRTDIWRFTGEISSNMAVVLGMIGAALFPIFGAVEEEKKRERERKIIHARIGERLDLVERAGRVAFHRMRKAASPDEKHELLSETARQFDLSEAAVEDWAKRYRRPFLGKVAKRRDARIWRLRCEGLRDREIADHPWVRVTTQTVKNILVKQQRERR